MIPHNSFYSWDIGPITVHAWGVLVAVGFLAALIYVLYRAKQEHIPKERIYDLFLYIIIGGLIGARLLHLTYNWGGFYAALKIWQGGLDFSGGFLGGILFAYIYLKKHHLSMLRYTDLFAPALPLAHFFGRLGCVFGDGGHVGKLTALPFGVLVNGEVRHLTAAYEAIFLLVMFFVMHKLSKRYYKKGFLTFTYIFSYSVYRFLNDLLRIDPTYYGLTVAQWFMVLGFLISGWFLFVRKK